MSNLKSFGAFWLREAKSGTKYMSGKVNGVDVVLFKNDKKEKENHPDYKVFVDIEKYPQYAEDKSQTYPEAHTEVSGDEIPF